MNWKNLFPRRSAGASPRGMVMPMPAVAPRLTPRHYDQLAREGYQRNVIVYRAVKLVSQNAAAIPWVVYDTAGGHKKPLPGHPLAQLLKQPNPLQGGAEFFESVYAFFLIAGNSYVEAIGPQLSQDRAPRELWSLRPDRMRVIPGRDGIPGGYRYTLGGAEAKDYAVNALTGDSDILHLKTFHPLDDWYGMSPLEAAAVSVDQHNDAAIWNASLLQSSGRPSGALVYRPASSDAPASLTDEQRQALRDDIERYFTGRDNAGKPLVLEGGLDWREMSLSPKDMDWTGGKDMSAREIALAFHVPPQLIGVEGSMTFANFEQARLALYDDAILPMVNHIKDELNRWLAPRIGAGIEIGFDIDRIEALAPRRDQVWARIGNAGFLTDNEKRALLGLPPVPDTGEGA